MSADSDRLVTGVREERPIDWDGLAVVLVGPSGVVAVAPDGKLQIRIEGRSVWLSVILKSSNLD